MRALARRPASNAKNGEWSEATAATSRKIVHWRTMVDESGQYCFTVPL
jgi:hypothetical protein